MQALRFAVHRALPCAGALALVLGSAASTHADVPNDTLRTAGATSAFLTQATAAIASFSTITSVFRACYSDKGAAGGLGDTHGCDGQGKGQFGDFLVLKGNLRDSDLPANQGLGVPGGATGVTYRVSSNDSVLGFQCINGSTVGFLAPEGFDGKPNTADDAGGTGTFGVRGPGRDPTAAVPTSPTYAEIGRPTEVAPPLTDCGASNPLAEFPNLLNTTLPAAANRFCVVNFDLHSPTGTSPNGAIQNEKLGVSVSPVRTNLGNNGADPKNESTNLSLSCDLGFNVLGPADYQDPVISQIPISDRLEVFGATIFKIVASRDVTRVGTTDEKVQLQDPQIENIFGPPSAGSVCSLGAVGATSAASSSDDLRVCYRENTAGAKEAFRLTFSANTGGDKPLGAGGNPPRTTTCQQLTKTGTPVTRRKTLHENQSNGQVGTCVSNNPKSFGYVNASRTGSGFYSVPIEGVDPDTNDLNLLVACGLYRYWAPLTGGESDPSVTTEAEQAHKTALRTAAIIPPGDDYLPFEDVAFRRDAGDSFYYLGFLPPLPNCPGRINPPSVKIPPLQP